MKWKAASVWQKRRYYGGRLDLRVCTENTTTSYGEDSGKVWCRLDGREAARNWSAMIPTRPSLEGLGLTLSCPESAIGQSSVVLMCASKECSFKRSKLMQYTYCLWSGARVKHEARESYRGGGRRTMTSPWRRGRGGGGGGRSYCVLILGEDSS